MGVSLGEFWSAVVDVRGGEGMIVGEDVSGGEGGFVRVVMGEGKSERVGTPEKHCKRRLTPVSRAADAALWYFSGLSLYV